MRTDLDTTRKQDASLYQFRADIFRDVLIPATGRAPSGLSMARAMYRLVCWAEEAGQWLSSRILSPVWRSTVQGLTRWLYWVQAQQMARAQLCPGTRVYIAGRTVTKPVTRPTASSAQDWGSTASKWSAFARTKTQNTYTKTRSGECSMTDDLKGGEG